MTTEWLVPSTRSQVIEDLVSGVGQCHFSLDIHRLDFSILTDRYNPSNIGILEDYLYHQIRSEEYDCLANLAVLKLYVFFRFPSSFSTDNFLTDISSIPIFTILM